MDLVLYVLTYSTNPYTPGKGGGLGLFGSNGYMDFKVGESLPDDLQNSFIHVVSLCAVYLPTVYFLKCQTELIEKLSKEDLCLL